MWAIQIIETVKATGSESDLMVRWTGDQARVVSAEQQLGAYDTLLVVFPPLLATLTTIVVLGLGGRQVAAGSLTIGALVAFQSLLAGFNQPFRDLARLGCRGPGAAGRPRPDRRRPASPDRPGARARPPAGPAVMDTLTRRGGSRHVPRLSGHLELRDVTFGYNRTVEEPLIKDFSLIVRPGPADRPGRRIGQRQVDARPPDRRALPALERRDPPRRQADRRDPARGLRQLGGAGR